MCELAQLVVVVHSVMVCRDRVLLSCDDIVVSHDRVNVAF